MSADIKCGFFIYIISPSILQPTNTELIHRSKFEPILGPRAKRFVHHCSINKVKPSLSVDGQQPRLPNNDQKRIIFLTQNIKNVQHKGLQLQSLIVKKMRQVRSEDSPYTNSLECKSEIYKHHLSLWGPVKCPDKNKVSPQVYQELSVCVCVWVPKRKGLTQTFRSALFSIF